MGVTCRYCNEPIPANFKVCWNCGASSDGAHPPTNPSALEVVDETPSLPDVPDVYRVRFRLIHLLALTTLLAVAVACMTDATATFVFTAVVVANVGGLIIGLLVTFLWGLPNDGSPPPGCSSSDDNAPA